MMNIHKLALVLVAGAGSILHYSNANAAEFTATAGAETKFLYRGVDLSPDENVSVNAEFRVQDAVVPGVYVRVGGNTVTLDGASSGTVRVDSGVGYFNSFGRIELDVSANRVVNPQVYSYDYTELRADVGVKLTDHVAVFGRLGHQLGNSTNEDTYLAAGAKVKWQQLTTGVQVAGYRYNDTTSSGNNQFRYNNTEVFAYYDLSDNVAVYGRYSFGGDGRYDGQKLDNLGTVGLRVSF